MHIGRYELKCLELMKITCKPNIWAKTLRREREMGICIVQKL